MWPNNIDILADAVAIPNPPEQANKEEAVRTAEHIERLSPERDPREAARAAARAAAQENAHDAAKHATRDIRRERRRKEEKRRIKPPRKNTK